MSEKCLYTFDALKIAFDFWLWMPLGLILLCIFSGYILQKQIADKDRRLTTLMILSFVGVISLLTAGSRLYAITRMQPVKLYTEHIETPFGSTTYFNIKDYFIRLQRDYKPMQPDAPRDSMRYLMIIERNDKTHLLSEGDYKIDSIFLKMNEIIGE